MVDCVLSLPIGRLQSSVQEDQARGHWSCDCAQVWSARELARGQGCYGQVQ